MYKFEKIADQGRTVKQNLFNAALPMSSAGYGSDTVKYTVPKNSTVYFKTFCSRANKGPLANIAIFVNGFSMFKTDTATSYSDTSYFKVSALLDRDIEIAFNLSVYGDHRAFVIDVLN